MATTPLLTALQGVVEVSATLAFAASGLLEAERKRLDPVGAFAGGWVVVGDAARAALVALARQC